MYRTNTCGELRLSDENKTVKLAGWLDTVRDLGAVIFFTIRDFYGITQVVVSDEDMKAEFKKHTDIDLNDEELKSLLSSKNYKEGDYMEVANSPNMTNNIVKLMNSRMCFGFTTGGHTGEEVLLAAYHPDGDVPMGHLKNTEINDYLFKVSGLKTPLPEMTQRIFAKHHEVFAGLKYTIENKDADIPVLVVKNKKNTPDRLEMNKYCRFCKKHTVHRETK